MDTPAMGHVHSPRSFCQTDEALLILCYFYISIISSSETMQLSWTNVVMFKHGFHSILFQTISILECLRKDYCVLIQKEDHNLG